MADMGEHYPSNRRPRWIKKQAGAGCSGAASPSDKFVRARFCWERKSRQEERAMRTGMFSAGMMGLLFLLPLTGCRSGGGRCQGGTCETTPGPTAGVGYVGESNQVAAAAPYGGQKTCPVSGASLAS